MESAMLDELLKKHPMPWDWTPWSSNSATIEDANTEVVCEIRTDALSNTAGTLVGLLLQAIKEKGKDAKAK